MKQIPEKGDKVTIQMKKDVLNGGRIDRSYSNEIFICSAVNQTHVKLARTDEAKLNLYGKEIIVCLDEYTFSNAEDF